jgi:hypothetical protein
MKVGAQVIIFIAYLVPAMSDDERTRYL